MHPNRSLHEVPYRGTVRHRFLKGLGANSVGQIINLATRVLLPPLFLKAWGADVYGEWLVLSSFVAYLSLTDMGGQMYIVNRLTQAYAQQDFSLFRRVLHTGFAIFLFMPTAVYLLFTSAILIVPPESFLPILKTDHQVVVWVLAILAFQFVFSLPQGILLGIYRAVGLLPRGVMLANLILFLQLALMLAALWLGSGMVLIAGLQMLPYPLVALIAVWELDRRFPQFSLLSLKGAEYSMGLTFVKPSLHFLSIQITQIFSIEGMILVVASVLSPIQVVVFSTTRTVVASMRQVLNLIAHTAWPEMTRLDAQQNVDGLYTLFRAVLRSSLILAAVLASIFHFFGDTIYHLWLGGEVEYEQVIMDLFLVYFLQLVFWLTCSHLLASTNRHHTLSKILLAASALTIVLALVGGRDFGLQGVIIGMILGDLILPFWCVPYLVGRYQARFSLSFFLKETAPVIVGLVGVFFLPWSAPITFLLLLGWCIAGLLPIAALEPS
jgi:O-antigen/teichoic acid export membrane protein